MYLAGSLLILLRISITVVPAPICWFHRASYMVLILMAAAAIYSVLLIRFRGCAATKSVAADFGSIADYIAAHAPSFEAAQPLFSGVAFGICNWVTNMFCCGRICLIRKFVMVWQALALLSLGARC